jgi:hypothetical protein
MDAIHKPENMEPYFGSTTDFRGWFSQPIWGHRLERQQPWALLMEFLGMADAMHRSQQLLAPTTPGKDCRYTANTQEHLRVLLFLNPRVEQIRNDHQGNDAMAWSEWLSVMKREAAVSESFTGDFEYLRNRFNSFDDLVNRVTLLNNIALDPGSKTKWSNKLLFPIGPAALHEVSDEKFARDRTVFTRTGEVAYLMISRASEHLRKELSEGFTKLLEKDTARNQLVLSLCPDGPLAQGQSKGWSYLPYKTHPAYDRLAEDLNNLLKLNLPNQDVLEHMRYTLGLNLYIYAVETTNHWLGKSELPPLPCEILGPKMDIVRKAAGVFREENERRGMDAIRKYIETTCRQTLQELAGQDTPEETKAEALADFVEEAFKIKKSELEITTTAAVIEKTTSIAKEIYVRDTLDGISALGTGAGLVDRRGTNRLRYAPTDKLLRAMVLATVKHPIKEDDLLSRWRERYGIIIGPEESESLPEMFQDKSDFEKNQRRFASRLTGLGLSNRMSDSCTYVRNPYCKET